MKASAAPHREEWIPCRPRWRSAPGSPQGRVTTVLLDGREQRLLRLDGQRGDLVDGAHPAVRQVDAGQRHEVIFSGDCVFAYSDILFLYVAPAQADVLVLLYNKFICIHPCRKLLAPVQQVLA